MAGRTPTIKKVSMRPDGSGTSTPGRRSAEREVEPPAEVSKPVEKKEPKREAKQVQKREEKHKEHVEEDARPAERDIRVERMYVYLGVSECGLSMQSVFQLIKIVYFVKLSTGMQEDIH